MSWKMPSSFVYIMAVTMSHIHGLTACHSVSSTDTLTTVTGIYTPYSRRGAKTIMSDTRIHVVIVVGDDN